MMREEAISFLESHQPMPPTSELKQETVNKYEEIRRFFIANPDPMCIPLFLNSFGDGDCFGVYQMVEDVIEQFEPSDVIPHLAASLRSEHNSVRYWSAQIASSFPSPVLIAPLSLMLSEQEFDLRWAAVVALENIEDPRVVQIMGSHKAKEQDEELLDLINEVLLSK